MIKQFSYLLISLIFSAGVVAADSVYSPLTGNTDGIEWKITWIEPPEGSIQFGALVYSSWELETNPVQNITHSHIHLCQDSIDACKSEQNQHLLKLRGRTEGGLLFEYSDTPSKRAEVSKKFGFTSGKPIYAIIHAVLKGKDGQPVDVYSRAAELTME